MYKLTLPDLNISSGSVGGSVASLGSLAQTLTGGVRAVVCAAHLLTNPASLLSFFTNLGASIGLLGISFISDLMRTAQIRIEHILFSHYGVVAGAYETIMLAINVVKELATILTNLLDKNNKFGRDLWKEFLKSEGCENYLADMTRCLFSKQLNQTLNEYKLSAIESINAQFDSIEGNTVPRLDSTAEIIKYANRQSIFVQKFNQQIVGIP